MFIYALLLSVYAVLRSNAKSSHSASSILRLPHVFTFNIQYNSVSMTLCDAFVFTNNSRGLWNRIGPEFNMLWSPAVDAQILSLTEKVRVFFVQSDSFC